MRRQLCIELLLPAELGSVALQKFRFCFFLCGNHRLCCEALLSFWLLLIDVAAEHFYRAGYSISITVFSLRVRTIFEKRYLVFYVECRSMDVCLQVRRLTLRVNFIRFLSERFLFISLRLNY